MRQFRLTCQFYQSGRFCQSWFHWFHWSGRICLSDKVRRYGWFRRYGLYDQFCQNCRFCCSTTIFFVFHLFADFCRFWSVDLINFVNCPWCWSISSIFFAPIDYAIILIQFCFRYRNGTNWWYLLLRWRSMVRL